MRIGTASLLAVLFLRLPALAETPISLRSVNAPNDGTWHYSVTPYVFVPQINGTFHFRVPGLGTSRGPVTISPHEPASKYLQHVNGLTMISGEARKNNFVTSFDYIWLNISTQKTGVLNVTGPSGSVVPIDSNAGFRVTANIWTVAAGGMILHANNATMDALIGVRSLNLKTAFNWNFSVPIPVLPQSGTVTKSGTVNDIVAEVRGKIRLGNRIFFPYYLDGGFWQR